MTGEPHGDGTPGGGEAPVPFHQHPRWQQVLQERDAARQEAQKLRELEAFAPLVAELRSQGISDGQTLLQQLREQQAAQERAAQEAELAQRFAQIDAEVEGGYIAPEIAERLKLAEQTLAQTQRQQAQLDNLLRQQAIAKARAEMPYLTEEAVSLLEASDPADVPQFAAIMGRMVQQAMQKETVDALREKKAAPPTPVSTGGGATAALPPARPGRPSFTEAFGHLIPFGRR